MAFFVEYVIILRTVWCLPLSTTTLVFVVVEFFVASVVPNKINCNAINWYNSCKTILPSYRLVEDVSQIMIKLVVIEQPMIEYNAALRIIIKTEFLVFGWFPSVPISICFNNCNKRIKKEKSNQWSNKHLVLPAMINDLYQISSYFWSIGMSSKHSIISIWKQY